MRDANDNNSKLQEGSFLLLLAITTVAFLAVLLPFYGGIFWAAVLAIIFDPMQRLLQKYLGQRPNTIALITLLVCLLIVIVPVLLVSGALVNEVAKLYQYLQSGQIDFRGQLEHIQSMLPGSVQRLLDQLDMGNLGSIQDKLTQGAMTSSRFLATQAFSFGQNTFAFIVAFGIMLYLLFFLLRDGDELLAHIQRALPLERHKKERLFDILTAVVRATVKGNIAVAVVQGVLGGLIFWILGTNGALLWGALMAFMALLPAVGAGIVWLPVAIYFLLTGSLGKGVTLILFGVFVIGLVDNLLRPILVGKDIKMPDYLVLISTLGGIALFGINGFVIGPLIAALFIACWSLLQEQNAES